MQRVGPDITTSGMEKPHKGYVSEALAALSIEITRREQSVSGDTETRSQNPLKRMYELIQLFLRKGDQKNLQEIAVIIKNNMNDPRVLELAGLFALERYNKTKDFFLILNAATLLNTLLSLQTEKHLQNSLLQQGVYTIAYLQIKSSEIGKDNSGLIRLLEILGKSFESWFLDNLTQDQDLTLSNKKEMLRHYKLFSPKSRK